MKANSRSLKHLIAVAPAIIAGITLAAPASARDFGFLPYGWLNMDIANKVINLGTSQATQGTSPDAPIQLPPADTQAGYRGVKTRTFSFIAGVYGGWYLNTGTFATTLFGAGAAILPVGGSMIVSDRFAKTEQEAKSLPPLKIPAHAEALKTWSPHDNVFYDTHGGVVFSVGAGYAFTGLSGDYLVQGDWTTYVEKLEGSKVFVKISNVAMNDVDTTSGDPIIYAMLSKFVKNDHFISYVFDVSDPRAAWAYEAMIHGSVKEAQVLEASHPELATQDPSEHGVTRGYQVKLFLGLPFLNRSRTYGSLYNFSDTEIYADHSQSDAQYGLYWDQSGSAVLEHHKGVSKSFYGITYKHGTDEGKYGRLILSYEDDHSTANTMREDLSKLIAQTGIQAQFAPGHSSLKGDIGYTHLTLTAVLSEAATRHLMNEEVNDSFPGSAESGIRVDSADFSESVSAVTEMQNALKLMSAADAKHDDVSFVTAYARFGKAMLKNAQTFEMVMRAVNGSPVDLTLQAEGEKISQLTVQLTPSQNNEVFLY